MDIKRFEKLSPDELVHQNAVIYAEACYRKFKANFDNWLENEGITLTDLQVPKAALAFMLAERVIIANFIILFFLIISAYLFSFIVIIYKIG